MILYVPSAFKELLDVFLSTTPGAGNENTDRGLSYIYIYIINSKLIKINNQNNFVYD